MNLSAPFINRPVMTTFVMLTIVIAGWISFVKLPVSDLPTIERPHIEVRTGYTGASAETVLNQVTIPLEKELTHVKGVQEISSKSSTGWSSIDLEFDLSKNMDEAIRDVQSAINKAAHRLPKDVDELPTYRLQQDSQDPIMYLVLTSENSNMNELNMYVDAYIIPRLSRIEGVSQVKTFGPGKSIWVRLNPELMTARHIGFNEVMDTIKQHTSQVPLGSIQTSNKTLALELSGILQHAKEIENLKIGNTSVRIKDIGEVSDKSEHDHDIHIVSAAKTTTGLILGIQKISDSNTVAISNAVKETIAVLKNELPSSIHLDVWFDKAIWIDASIMDVEWSLLLAFALVVLVIYFSLGRLSEAFIASVALPLSLVGTFAIMHVLHFNLDLLSLLALTLSVGFVVDDAIVVLENIVRHQEEGASPREASLSGSKQICFTILSMTVSLVAVFIPLLFMSGINGRLFREFSVTLAMAIIVSGFISLTLTPMLCSKFLSAHTSKTRLQIGIHSVNTWMVNLYGKSLRKCFHFPKTILLVAAACVGFTVYLFPKLPVNLVPPEDRGFLITMVNLPTGIGPEATKEQQTTLEKLIREKPYVDNFLDISYNGGLIFVIRLLPHAERPPQPAVIADLQKSVDTIPGTQTFIQGYQLINLDFDLGNGGQYQYVIRGLDFHDVDEAATLITQVLQSHPETVSFVKSSLKNDTPKLVIHVNDDLAHQLGFSKQHVQNLLQQAYGQGQIGTIQRGANQEEIYLELQKEYQNHAGALANLHLATSTGGFVPLKALAHWEEKLGSPSLHRLEQLPSVTLRFSLTDPSSPNVGLKKVEEIAAKSLPGNVSGVLTGAAKAISSTVRDTSLLLLAAAVVMYIVLGILYESFIHPLTILSSLPLAGLGGVLTLFLFNEPISIFSAVGFLLLVGIVKKNGIMMVDYALEAEKHGATSEEAIYQGCLVRFRPIMMTTIAAIMGALPIAIGLGDGAEMRRGLGLVIVGGLMFSQVLTLYVTPIIFLSFEKLKSLRKGPKSAPQGI